MDEPFGALDTQTKGRMQSDLLTTWQQTKKTVIFVTHDLDEAIFLSDQVIVLWARAGQINHIGSIQLARPKDYTMRLTGEFIQLKCKQWACLNTKLLKTQAHLSASLRPDS